MHHSAQRRRPDDVAFGASFSQQLRRVFLVVARLVAWLNFPAEMRSDVRLKLEPKFSKVFSPPASSDY